MSYYDDMFERERARVQAEPPTIRVKAAPQGRVLLSVGTLERLLSPAQTQDLISQLYHALGVSCDEIDDSPDTERDPSL